MVELLIEIESSSEGEKKLFEETRYVYDGAEEKEQQQRQD